MKNCWRLHQITDCFQVWFPHNWTSLLPSASTHVDAGPWSHPSGVWEAIPVQSDGHCFSVRSTKPVVESLWWLLLQPEQIPLLVLNQTLLFWKRKNWHHSLHSKTRSHNCGGRAHQLPHFYTEEELQIYIKQPQAEAMLLNSRPSNISIVWAHCPPFCFLPPPTHSSPCSTSSPWGRFPSFAPGDASLMLGFFQQCIILATPLQIKGLMQERALRMTGI